MEFRIKTREIYSRQVIKNLPTFEMEWRNATFTLDDVACYQLFALYSAFIFFLRLFSTLISCMTNYSLILARRFSVNV